MSRAMELGNVYKSAQAEDLSKQAWQWFLPQELPTLGLVLGVLANLELVPAARAAAQRRHVTDFFLKLTIGLSLFYLLLLMVIELAGGAKDSAAERIGLLQNSGLFLGPIQGLVGCVMGVFFISGDSTATEPNAAHGAAQPAAAAAASPGHERSARDHGDPENGLSLNLGRAPLSRTRGAPTTSRRATFQESSPQPGSLTPTTSNLSMRGGSASKVAAFAMSAAAMRPSRCA